MGCSPTSGVPEVWDRAGAPTPLCAGRSPTCLDEERCVVTSTAWEGALCVCMFVTEGNLEICGCMLLLVAGLWLSVVADADPECIVQDC